MSDREKEMPPAGRARAMDPELLAFLNGPPPQDDYGIDLSLIRETLAMTLEERAERHYQARLFAEHMRAAGREVHGHLHPTAKKTR